MSSQLPTNGATTPDEPEPAPAPAPDAQTLADLLARLREVPDSEQKTQVLEILGTLTDLSEEEELDESRLSGAIESAIEILPDVAEVAISTLVNPAGGLMTLFHKIAKRVSSKAEE